MRTPPLGPAETPKTGNSHRRLTFGVQVEVLQTEVDGLLAGKKQAETKLVAVFVFVVVVAVVVVVVCVVVPIAFADGGLVCVCCCGGGGGCGWGWVRHLRLCPVQEEYTRLMNGLREYKDQVAACLKRTVCANFNTKMKA